MFIQKFDTLRLVLPEECYSRSKKLNLRSSTEADEKGVIASEIQYLSKSEIQKTNPFGVSRASINSYKYLKLDISSKILLENYHKGITKETIAQVFSQLKPLGFEIDTVSALKSARVKRADAFIDIAVDGNLDNVLSLFKFFFRKNNTYIKNHRGSIESYINNHILSISLYLKFKELHSLQAGYEVTDEEFYEVMKYRKRNKKAKKQRQFLEIIDVEYFRDKIRIEARFKLADLILIALKSDSKILNLGELLNTNVNLIGFALNRMYLDLDKIDILSAAKSKMTYSKVINEYGWNTIMEQGHYDFPTITDFFKSCGANLCTRNKDIIKQQIVSRLYTKKTETVEFQKNLKLLLNNDHPTWKERSLKSILK